MIQLRVVLERFYCKRIGIWLVTKVLYPSFGAKGVSPNISCLVLTCTDYAGIFLRASEFLKDIREETRPHSIILKLTLFLIWWETVYLPFSACSKPNTVMRLSPTMRYQPRKWTENVYRVCSNRIKLHQVYKMSPPFPLWKVSLSDKKGGQWDQSMC